MRRGQRYGEGGAGGAMGLRWRWWWWEAVISGAYGGAVLGVLSPCSSCGGGGGDDGRSSGSGIVVVVVAVVRSQWHSVKARGRGGEKEKAEEIRDEDLHT